MYSIKNIWSSTNHGWRHITKSMDQSKKQRIIKRVNKNLLDNSLYDNVETVLELRNGLFNIIAGSNYYKIGLEAEYKLINNANTVDCLYKPC